MKLFNKVAIIGVGLIGGSIGMELKKRGLCRSVIGVSRHARSIQEAKRRKAVDIGSTDIGIIKDADFVIFCAPVSTILKLAPTVSKIIRKDCIVTDAGSTKARIVSALEGLFPHYAGSHPLAGSEKRGVSYARPDLFQDALCIVTRSRNTDTKALRKVMLFWKGLGSKTTTLSPDVHDTVLSFVSHLPHVLAFSLIKTVPRDYLRFASGGLRDTTRIASSDSNIWEDVFMSNSEKILGAICAFNKQMRLLSSALRKKDAQRLKKLLDEAKQKRDSLEK